MTEQPRPRAGDKYVWYLGEEPTEFITVVRVARDGSWADLRVCNWAREFRKRQPLPFADGFRPRQWSRVDLDRAYDRMLAQRQAHAERLERRHADATGEQP